MKRNTASDKLNSSTGPSLGIMRLFLGGAL